MSELQNNVPESESVEFVPLEPIVVKKVVYAYDVYPFYERPPFTLQVIRFPKTKVVRCLDGWFRFTGFGYNRDDAYLDWCRQLHISIQSVLHGRGCDYEGEEADFRIVCYDVIDWDKYNLWKQSVLTELLDKN
jgi:hypothetical protein